MSVQVTTNKAGPYLGTGAQVIFAFGFKIFLTSDVVVTKTSTPATASVESTLALGADYTVAMNVDQDNNPGGSVTLTVAPAGDGTAPNSEKVTLSRAVPETQGTGLPQAGPYNAKILEKALDRVTILVQQLREIFGRTPTFSVSDTPSAKALPNLATRKSTALGFDANGDFAAYSPASAVTDSANVTYTPTTGALAGVVHTIKSFLDKLGNAGAALGAALIGFLQSGAGAVGTTVQREIRGLGFAPEQFGALGNGNGAGGGTNDYAALLACITAAQAVNGWVILDGQKTYRCDTGLTIDYSKIGISGCGALLDFTNMAAGNALTLVSAGVASPFRALRKGIHNLELKAARAAGQVAVCYGDGVNYSAQTLLDGVVIHDFAQGLKWTNNAYRNSHQNVEIYNCDDIAIFAAGLANAGERVSFVDCDFFNSTNGITVNGASFHYKGASFDYITNFAMKSLGGGKHSLIEGHIETNTDGDYLLTVPAGTTGWISLKDTNIALTGNRTKEIGNNTSTVDVCSGDNVQVRQTAGTYTPDNYFLGAWKIRNSSNFDQTAIVLRPWVNQNNLLVDGGFEAVPYALAEFDMQTGGALNEAPTLDAVTFHGGAKSLHLATTAIGNRCSIRRSWPIVPGAKPTVLLWAKTNFLNAADALNITARYRGRFTSAVPVSISAPTRTLTFNTVTPLAAWTQQRFRPFQVAPAGATDFELDITLTNAAALSEAWIDDVQVEILDNDGAVERGFRGSMWLPVLRGDGAAGVGTYTDQVGYYYRNGNFVWVFGFMAWTAHTGTGNMVVALPFKAKNFGNCKIPGTLVATNLTFANQLGCEADSNGTDLKFVTTATGAGLAQLAMDVAATVYFSICYEIDS